MDGWLDKPIGWNQIDVSDKSLVKTSLENYDQEYIIVLAGGLDNNGHCHPWYEDRLKVVIKLNTIKERKVIVLGGGTYHKPPILNKEKYVLHESTIGAKYLVDNGINPKNIYREWGSYDTIANGYFSLVNFVIPLNIKDILLITSDFHMKRSKLIFDWIYHDLYHYYYDDYKPKLRYLEVNSDNLDNEIIEVRKQREVKSIENLNNLQKTITDWNHFIDWFYHEHKAYNCDFDNDLKEDVSHEVKKSY